MASEQDETAAESSRGEDSLTASQGQLGIHPEPEQEAIGAVEDTESPMAGEDDFHPGLRLWIIILGLGVTLLLTALENTVVTVAMPYIISDLEIGDDYIWITNAFFICRCVNTTVDVTTMSLLVRHFTSMVPLSVHRDPSSPGI